MGTAMLRGWIAAGVASRFLVIEPAGMPAGLDSSAEILWYPGPDALPSERAAEAVVFAVKPQVVDASGQCPTPRLQSGAGSRSLVPTRS